MKKTGFCDVGCGSELFWGVFLTLFQANLPLNMLVTLDSNFFHENLWKKLSPRDQKFRWYKYVHEGLKRENFFL